MLERFAIADLSPTPWKNGGGSTREIVCRPQGAGVDGFDWRVSLATIAQSGPFSVFAGVDRVILLLDGDGVRLQSADGVDHRLDQALQPFAFPGEEALDCTLLGGPSQDFNVMTRRRTLRAELRVLRAPTPIAPTPSGLLLAVRGHWQLHADGGAQDCAAGQGLWWDGEQHGWHVKPQGDDPALLWVRLETVGVDFHEK
ncbi:MAG: HutD family protein [Burkholderiaceae bacterium]|nr:HutD family protein [Burkholderiaceae bacterium]